MAGGKPLLSMSGQATDQFNAGSRPLVELCKYSGLYFQIKGPHVLF